MDELSPYEAAQLLREIDLVELKESAENSLAEFVKQAWHVLEPGTDLQWNWHLDTLCAYLEAVAAGKITFLVVNIPPGTMKSLIVSVFYPAWRWVHEPEHRFLCGTNESSLADRDALRMRTLVESNWYRSQWGLRYEDGVQVDHVKISSHQRKQSLFANSRLGHRESQAIMASITGKRGDSVIWDDPHDVGKTNTPEALSKVRERWSKAWSNRVNDLAHSARILVMQRLHMQDATNLWLESLEGVVHLRIPMRYEVEEGPGFDAGKDIGRPEFNDPRTKDGELMFPGLFPEAAVAQQEITLGTYGTAGQMQQRPSPEGGGEFKRSHIMHYTQAPKGGNRYIIVDPAGEKKKTNIGQKRDNSAMLVVEACEDQNVYLIDAYRDRLDLVERTDILFKWHRKYRPIGVGYESSGHQSDVSHIRGRMEQEGYRFNIVDLPVAMPKNDRIRRLLPWFGQNRIWLPEELHRTTFDGKTVDIVEEFIEKEYLPFPVAAFDDLFDALSRICDDELKLAFPTPRKPRRHVTNRPKDASMGY